MLIGCRYRDRPGRAHHAVTARGPRALAIDVRAEAEDVRRCLLAAMVAVMRAHEREGVSATTRADRERAHVTAFRAAIRRAACSLAGTNTAPAAIAASRRDATRS